MAAPLSSKGEMNSSSPTQQHNATAAVHGTSYVARDIVPLCWWNCTAAVASNSGSSSDNFYCQFRDSYMQGGAICWPTDMSCKTSTAAMPAHQRSTGRNPKPCRAQPGGYCPLSQHTTPPVLHSPRCRAISSPWHAPLTHTAHSLTAHRRTERFRFKQQDRETQEDFISLGGQGMHSLDPNKACIPQAPAATPEQSMHALSTGTQCSHGASFPAQVHIGRRHIT